MSYDKKFREKTIEYYEKGNTYRETAETFVIAVSTLTEWIRRKREEGELERKYRSYKTKINKEELSKYLREYPDAYQAEISKYFNCSVSTVCKTLKQLKITRKKK